MQEDGRRRLSSCFLQHPVRGGLSEAGGVQSAGGEAVFTEHTEVALVEAEQGELRGDGDPKRRAELHNRVCDPVGAAEEGGGGGDRLQEATNPLLHLSGRHGLRQEQQGISGEGQLLLPQHAEKGGKPRVFLRIVDPEGAEQFLRASSPKAPYRRPYPLIFVGTERGEALIAAMQEENRRAGVGETFIEIEIRIFTEPEDAGKDPAEAAPEAVLREEPPFLEKIRLRIEDLEPEAPLPERAPKRMDEHGMGIVVRMVQQQRDTVFPFCRGEPAQEAAAALCAAEIASLREDLQGGAHGSPTALIAERELPLCRETIAALLKIFANFCGKLGKESFCFVHFGKYAGYFLSAARAELSFVGFWQETEDGGDGKSKNIAVIL